MASVKTHRSILIVEDEEIIRTTLREFLTGEGYVVADAGTVGEALRLARQRDFDVAVCDVQLPDGDGLALLRRLQQVNLETSVLVITAYATVENAVEAFKAGAFDYLVKPVIFEDLAHKLERLYRYRQVHIENQVLRRELARRGDFDQIVGSSKVLADLQETIRKVAVTNSNVLVDRRDGHGQGTLCPRNPCGRPQERREVSGRQLRHAPRRTAWRCSFSVRARAPGPIARGFSGMPAKGPCSSTR